MSRLAIRTLHKNILWLLLLTTSVILLSGCGFSFRGKTNHDLSGIVVAVDAQENFHPLVLRLKRKLLSSGAIVDQSGLNPELSAANDLHSNQQTVLLFVSNPIEKQKTLSVDETGRPLEYELYIEISAIVTANQIENISTQKINPSKIFARRVLVYDNNELLAKSREREQVRNDIYDVLIGQLIERIRGAHADKS